MLKYLRISVTALSLTACVLLIALWVRGFWTVDSLAFPITESRYVSFHSRHGGISFVTGAPPVPKGWGWRSSKVENFTSVEVLPEYREVLGFGYVWLPGMFSIVVPNWFLILVSLCLAMQPWCQHLRRFSLRTMLIATTLVAVGLGVIALSR